MASERISDDVLAVLAGFANPREAVRRIVERISRLEGSGRDMALAQLATLAGLRGLEDMVREEASVMPITEDITDHKIIGTALKQGRAEGLREGRIDGELRLLCRQAERKFGALPGWATERLSSSNLERLEQLGLKLLDAPNLPEWLS